MTAIKSIQDLSVSDTLKDMIARSCWSPNDSGWRPFENAEEAEIIKEENLLMRGCNWVAKAVSLGESSGIFHCTLGYAEQYARNMQISYKDLFRSYKVANGSLPCGLPIETA